ncbi:MAG TPA: response regulator transcription factor [Chloroflexota bacterium]|nr:response regulator transcription factor [Chloroflexota bacterium]
MHILVVEDERRLANLVRRALEEEGHVVDVCLDGAEALEMAQGTDYDLLVLDIMLPRVSGIEICRTLRAEGKDTRILMLTARDAVEDRVEGLESGADDYLVKPFSFAELIARVKALSRRSVQPQADEELISGDLVLDLSRHEVRRGDTPIELTAKEFQLLEYLMRNAGRVLTRTQILDHVWGYNFDSFSNVVDIYVHYLRNKIDRDFREPLIKTVRGVGYKLEA